MKQLSDRGMILPVVLVGLMVMSMLAVAAILTSGDEHRSAQALHESGVVFYAAEAGIQEVWGSWDNATDSLVRTLSPGDTLDLGWSSLGGGARYHGFVIRTDDGTTDRTYMLAVEGRGSGARGGRRLLSAALEVGPGAGGTYTLGSCCDAVATTRGLVKVNTSIISGEDSIPSLWDPSRCSEFEPTDVPAIVTDDETNLNIRDNAIWTGDPPLVVDPTISDSAFYQYGDLNLDSLLNRATTHLENWNGSQKGLDYQNPAPSDCGTTNPITSGDCPIGPRYNMDGSCDTSHPLNFGAPTGPCKDHFPIVRVSGDWALDSDAGSVYAQGIFIMDTSTVDDFGSRITQTGIGSEFDIEGNNPSQVAGIVIGRGCFELDSPTYGWSWFYGAVFSDGSIDPNVNCNGDEPLYLHSETSVQYSQCVVQKALKETGVGESSGGAYVNLIKSRALREILR